MCDQSTAHIGFILREAFKPLGIALSKDYCGEMQHLWIDFELIRHHWEGRPLRSFRFSKKVGGGWCPLLGMPTQPKENVGHYNVVPDFDVLMTLKEDRIIPYAMTLLYDSTAVLISKQKRLGGFDAAKFRADFHSYCSNLGYFS